MKLVFLGPPGAGKGTQAERVCSRLCIPHISTGDMLRSEIAACTDAGKLAKTLISEGELVPDDMIVAMVRSRIAQEDAKNGFLLDGFPRTIAQAQLLDETIDIDCAVDIDAPVDMIVARLSERLICMSCRATYSTSECDGLVCKRCGNALTVRDDDKPEAVRNRIVVYEEQTLPIIEYYRSKGKLVSVDGSDARDVVFESIMSALLKMGE